MMGLRILLCGLCLACAAEPRPKMDLSHLESNRKPTVVDPALLDPNRRWIDLSLAEVKALCRAAEDDARSLPQPGTQVQCQGETRTVSYFTHCDNRKVPRDCPMTVADMNGCSREMMQVMREDPCLLTDFNALVARVATLRACPAVKKCMYSP
jgi:hypothetical protein